MRDRGRNHAHGLRPSISFLSLVYYFFWELSGISCFLFPFLRRLQSCLRVGRSYIPRALSEQSELDRSQHFASDHLLGRIGRQWFCLLFPKEK